MDRLVALSRGRAAMTTLDQAVYSLSSFILTATLGVTAEPGRFGRLTVIVIVGVSAVAVSRSRLGVPLLGQGDAAVVTRGMVARAAAITFAGMVVIAVLSIVTEEPVGWLLAVAVSLLVTQDLLRYLFLSRGLVRRCLVSDGVWVVVQIVALAVVATRAPRASVVILAWLLGLVAATVVLAWGTRGRGLIAVARRRGAAAPLPGSAMLYLEPLVIMARLHLVALVATGLAGWDQFGGFRFVQTLFGAVPVLQTAFISMDLPLAATHGAGALRRRRPAQLGIVVLSCAATAAVGSLASLVISFRALEELDASGALTLFVLVGFANLAHGVELLGLIELMARQRWRGLVAARVLTAVGFVGSILAVSALAPTSTGIATGYLVGAVLAIPIVGAIVVRARRIPESPAPTAEAVALSTRMSDPST